MTPTHRLTTTAAVMLSLAAIGVPAATARPADDPAITANRAPATVYSRPDKSLIPLSTPNGDSISKEPSAPQGIVRVQIPPSGFDWGDAGIGAAGGIGITMLVAGGGLVLVRTRRDHLDPTSS